MQILDEVSRTGTRRTGTGIRRQSARNARSRTASRCRSLSSLQAPPRAMPAAPDAGGGAADTALADPQLLLATHLQGPVGDSDRFANFGDIKGLRRVFLHCLAKLAHD